MANRLNAKKSNPTVYKNIADEAQRPRDAARRSAKADTPTNERRSLEEVMARKGYYSRNGGYGGYRGL